MKSSTTRSQGISKGLRFFVILQLCFVFTLLAWEGVYAFSRDSLSKKSKVDLYQYALAHAPHEANTSYLHSLPDYDQTILKNEYRKLIENEGRTFTQKIISVIYAWCYEISPWFQAWALLSFACAFLTFFQIKGTRVVIWALPLTISGYAYFHHYVIEPPSTPSSSLVPTEQELVSNYLEKPLSSNITEQKKDLEFAWKTYLIDRWSHEKPSDDISIFEKQAERGYYYFVVANLKSTNPQTIDTFTSPLFRKAPLILVILYLLWNLAFAGVISYGLGKRPKVRN